MSTDWRQRPAVVAAAGAAAGALVTVFAVSLVWPDDTNVDSTQTSAVVTPSVRPSPTRTDLLGPSNSESSDPSAEADPSDGGQDDESDDEQGGGEPKDAPPLADAAPAGQGQLPDASSVSCPPATTTVSDTGQLEDALANARPGNSIELEDGTYSGDFVTSASG